MQSLIDGIFNYTLLRTLHAGVGASSEEQLQYNRSMSDEDFCRWLRSRGISEKDCKALSGKVLLYSFCIIQHNNIKFY